MATLRTRPKVKEIKDAYDHLLRSSSSLSKIKDAALGGRLFPAADESKPGVVGRSLAWKLFLVPTEPLQSTVNVAASPPLGVLVENRAGYKTALLERMSAPDGSYEDGLIIPGTDEPAPRTRRTAMNLDRNNPLSLDDENPWTEWFSSMELRKTILQDVERTFPDIDYFRDQEVQTQLTNILFVYSSAHPDIGYRQGMHELLACLYYAIDYDSIPSNTTETDDSALKEFCARSWVAADAWTLFSTVMQAIGRWYEWQAPKNAAAEKTPLASHVQFNLAADISGLKPYVAPIVQACHRIQSTLLKSVDPELWKRLQSAGIEPQIYGIRWLRLLFTREFRMYDVMVLWDALFACDPSFDLAEWICVAMLVRIRNQLIPSDYSGQLTYLLRYPSQPVGISDNPDGQPVHPCTLLIRQALTLQMSPSPTTGVSIIYENRNLLDIPVDVPQPPPPPIRRGPQMGQRGHSGSPSSGSPPRFNAEAGSSRPFGSHQRNGSAMSMGLPEMIARGLLERGESLGINKTVMNAVSELKRNLPDLASSLARLPTSPGSMQTAYPMVDERPPAERPPWEPRTRFEMEKDVADVRVVHKRLGESVAWIVDTLLLDEGDSSKSEDEKKDISRRKREALESLSYVRDVLQRDPGPSDLDEDRLLSEEEAQKRREAKAAERERAASPSSQMPVQERLRYSPMPVPTPMPSQPPKAAASEDVLSPGWKGSSGYFPTPPMPVSSGLSRPRAPVSAPIPSAPPPSLKSAPLSPNANGMPLAPWVRSPSNFSSDTQPFATLPRVPPKTSSALRAIHNRLPSSGPPSAVQSPPDTKPRAEAPHKVTIQSDPLGALQ